MVLFVGELCITGFEITAVSYQYDPIQDFIHTRCECNASMIFTLANITHFFLGSEQNVERSSSRTKCSCITIHSNKAFSNSFHDVGELMTR